MRILSIRQGFTTDHSKERTEGKDLDRVRIAVGW